MSSMRILAALLSGTFLVFAGCSRGHDHEHSHDHHGHAHVHIAPHGGVLHELGNHAHNLELVTRPGGFDLYVLDSHATNFVRIASPMIAAQAVVAGTPIPIVFAAQANPATGERVGQTSHFAAVWTEAAPPAEIRIDQVEVQGATYRDLVIVPGKPGAAPTTDLP